MITHGKLVLATDIGVFVADARTPTSWSRLGFGQTHSVVNGLTLTPEATVAGVLGFLDSAVEVRPRP